MLKIVCKKDKRLCKRVIQQKILHGFELWMTTMKSKKTPSRRECSEESLIQEIKKEILGVREKQRNQRNLQRIRHGNTVNIIKKQTAKVAGEVRRAEDTLMKK